jgi:hypothetical protein
VSENETMTFHADFWVAAATGAPVIALSSTVVISDSYKLVQRARECLEPPSSDWRRAHRLIMNWYFIASANMGIQIFIMLFSLLSLGQDTNFVPVSIAIIGEVVGLLLVLLVTQGNGRAQQVISTLESKFQKTKLRYLSSYCKRPERPQRRLHAHRAAVHRRRRRGRAQVAPDSVGMHREFLVLKITGARTVRRTLTRPRGRS